ncbi:MAG: hypothetical protein ACFFAO_07595 [Candidatus Hermodarchaeota archaeon]
MKTEEKINKIFLKQINDVLKDYNNNKGLKSSILEGGNNDLLIHNLITRIFATIERIVGKNSEYYKHALKITSGPWRSSKMLDFLIGTIEGLYHDLKNSYLKSLTEIIHSDIFGDYLEMAEHLLKEGYKDPAAVIIGSTLERHLKQLCLNNGIDINIQTGNRQKPKSSSQINSELAKNKIYSKLDQKSITVWLDLRNKAAHGNYNDYNSNKVEVMAMGIRDFINRNPA